MHLQLGEFKRYFPLSVLECGYICISNVHALVYIYNCNMHSNMH